MKKTLFVVMLVSFAMPAIAATKPPRERHVPTPAVKSHFAKLHIGR